MTYRTYGYYEARIYDAESVSEVAYLMELAQRDDTLTDYDRLRVMELADWMIGEMMP